MVENAEAAKGEESEIENANDANGNTLSDASGKSYTWDFENRLTQAVNPGIGTTTFRYDPFGRRIQKSGPLGTTNYLYEGMGTRANIIEEVDDLASVQARYAQTLAIDQPLAEFRSGTTSFYEQDALSSVSSLSNSAGVLANTYTSDSFGQALTSSGTLVNDMRYTGRELDLESSLLYYRHRFYDPAIGRFLNEDENEFYGGTNFYSYVNNSPLVYVDPFGLARCVLSVYEHTLICFPELPGHDAVIIPVASGNNGGGMECKNDPTCDPIPDHGPIPRGDWEWTKDKTTKPNGRVLKPG